MGNVPTVPQFFVDRPEVSERLEAALRAKAASSGAIVIGAIQGLPGIGKTLLAAHLARKMAERGAFRDGVFWITLGQRPGNLLSLLGDLIQEMGDRTYEPKAMQTASGHLKGLFRDKNALLVIDDAWDPGDVRWFLLDGPRCRVLVTTRDLALASALHATALELDVMSPEQALAFFSARLGRKLDGEAESAAALGKLLGYLPLALELAAAQVEAGEADWEGLARDLQQEVARLDRLEPIASRDWEPDDRRMRSVEACFELSLRRLEPARRVAFAWLGVLREDVLLVTALASGLWGVDRDTAAGHLRYFRAKGLLSAGPVLDGGEPTYRLHDLMRKLAFATLARPRDDSADRFGLGLGVQGAHGAFLDRQRARAVGPTPPWPAVPDDGYLYDHLAWHLERAGRVGELFELLDAETTQGRHAWYDACERQGRVLSFLSTVREAWSIADREFRESRSAVAFGRTVRCALLLSSTSSLSSSLPPELVVGLIRESIWPAAQGLAQVRRVVETVPRLRALCLLLDEVPELQQDDVLGEVLDGISDVPSYDFAERSRLLQSIAPHLAGRRALLERAVGLADTVEAEPDRIRAWDRLAPALDHAQADALLGKIKRFYDKDPAYQAWAEAVLLPRLDPPRIDVAIERARVIGYPHQRALALSGLAATASGPLQSSLVREALGSLLEAKYRYDRAEVFARLAPLLGRDGPPGDGPGSPGRTGSSPRAPAGDTRSLIEVAWQAELALWERSERDAWYESGHSRSVQALAPALASREPIATEAVRSAIGLESEAESFDALAALVLHLPKSMPSRQLAEARLKQLVDAPSSPPQRARRLIGLARLADGPAGRDLLAEARALLLTIGDQDAGRRAMEGLLSAALAGPGGAALSFEQFQSIRPRLKILNGKPGVTASSGVSVLPALLACEDAAAWPEALRSAAARVPDPLARARWLDGVAALHPDGRRGPVLAEALDLVLGLADDQARWKVLSTLAPGWLGERRLVPRVLEAAGTLADPAQFASLAARLAPSLEPAERDRLLREACDRVGRMADDKEKREVLAGLAEQIDAPGAIGDGLWEVAAALADPAERAGACLDLIARGRVNVTPDRIQSCREAIRAIPTPLARAGAWDRLRPLLDPPEQDAGRRERDVAYREAIEAARASNDAHQRARALARLAGLAPSGEKDERIGEAIAAIIQLRSAPEYRDYRDDYVADVVMVLANEVELPVDALRPVLFFSQLMVDPQDRAFTFAALLRHVPEQDRITLFHAALQAAAAVDNPDYRVITFRQAILPNCPRSERVRALSAAVRAAIERGSPADLRAMVAGSGDLDGSELLELWASTLDFLSGRERKDLLEFQEVAPPILDRLEGPASCVEVTLAIADAERWFP